MAFATLSARSTSRFGFGFGWRAAGNTHFAKTRTRRGLRSPPRFCFQSGNKYSVASRASVRVAPVEQLDVLFVSARAVKSRHRNFVEPVIDRELAAMVHGVIEAESAQSGHARQL